MTANKVSTHVLEALAPWCGFGRARTTGTLVPLLFSLLVGASISCAISPPGVAPLQDLASNATVVRFQCKTCHTIAGDGGTVGPVLDRIGNRRNADWLRKWLTNPSAVKPGTLMPNFQLGKSNIEDLVVDMLATKRAVPSQEIIAAANSQAEAGETLMNEFGCFACHRIGAMGRDNGPDLTWIGVWQDMDWEKQWLKNPDHWRPGTFMPNFGLKDPEIGAIVAFLGTLKGERGEDEPLWRQPGYRNNPTERGRLIFDKLGCAGCHGTDGRTGGFRNPNAAPDAEVPNLLATGSKHMADQIKAIILDGSVPQRLDVGSPRPPLESPAWRDKISSGDLDDLVVYVKSLSPR